MSRAGSIQKPQKLERDRLWRLASEVALYAYSQLNSFPQDEEYGMQPRLRDRSFDLTTDVAEAVGSIDPRDKAFCYGLALRDAYGVRNTLIMANKTGMLSVEPAIFVKLDELAEGLSAEVAETTDDIPEYLKQFAIDNDNRDNR